MTVQTLLDKIGQMKFDPAAGPEVPPPELIAFFVRWVRGVRQWKKTTLASFAGVSLSTIERVERGEKVSDENLDRIATALGYERGYFTEPRRALSPEVAAKNLETTIGNLEPVAVSPMRSHRKVREAARCHAFLLHHPDVDAELVPQLKSLGEWLDLASFILSTPDADHMSKRGKRDLYEDILGCVRDLERQGLIILSGVMSAPQDGIADWRIAVISATRRATDPGAEKRRNVFVDRRHAELRNHRHGSD